MQAHLLSEHLGATEKGFAEVFAAEGSLIATVETLNAPAGRGLREIEKRETNVRSGLLADTRVLDSRYHPAEVASTGEGVRPRHVLLAAGAAVLGYLGLFASRK